MRTEPKYLRPETAINKKLGNLKFDEIFNVVAINRTEVMLAKYQSVFSKEVQHEFNKLFKNFMNDFSEILSGSNYKKLFEDAFSLKSRAGHGGFPIITEVANSLYRFAEKAMHILPENGYLIAKLHLDAMSEIFNNRFPKDNKLAVEKLISGLKEVTQKYS